MSEIVCYLVSWGARVLAGPTRIRHCPGCQRRRSCALLRTLPLRPPRVWPLKGPAVEEVQRGGTTQRIRRASATWAVARGARRHEPRSTSDAHATPVPGPGTRAPLPPPHRNDVHGRRRDVRQRERIAAPRRRGERRRRRARHQRAPGSASPP